MAGRALAEDRGGPYPSAVLAILALSLLGLAVALVLFLRAGASERRPELRMTREQELLRQAEEHHRRLAERPAEPPALPGRDLDDPPEDRPRRN